MLDDLVSVIETLQQRIRDHGPALRENETRTRTALIDPMLTVLGWDTADPKLVTPEYRVNVGWADYALEGPGNKRAAIIEAKRLGSIVENHLEQAVGYCIQQGIAYAGVTDGSHWQLYRTFEPVPMVEKLVLDVHISDAPAHESALKLLLLWRPNLASGKAIPAEVPILATTLPTDAQNSATALTELPTIRGGNASARLQSVEPVSRNNNRGGYRRRWMHPDQPDNVLTLKEAYQLVKSEQSEREIQRIEERVNNGELKEKSKGNMVWSVQKRAVSDAGYIRQ